MRCKRVAGRVGDDLVRLLRNAFRARAEAAVPDARPVPRPPAPLRHGLSALGMMLAAAFLVAACSSSASGGTAPSSTTASASSASTRPSTPAAPSTSAGPVAKPVHIALLNSDGSDYGVGMPVIAQFNRKVTSGVALQRSTTVTVDGKPVEAAWFLEYSDPASGHVMEAHLRMAGYWPAHARIHVGIATKGLSAGTGLSFDDSLTLDFTTHARIVSTVDESTHRMTVTDDGRTWGTFPVSLGASDTPTARGIKVIMEKGRSICMSGPGYHDCGVKYTQRLTYGGEYLHSAPWNCRGAPGCIGPMNNIGSGDSSNGCTNLRPADAKKLYGFLGIGDVVVYPNANGPAMTLGAGYGDWNVTWPTWLTGGAVPTT